VAVQDLGSREILQVLVVHDDVYWKGRTVQILLPYVEGFEYCVKVLVVYIVVEFGWVE
jgi:hypothetical protein